MQGALFENHTRDSQEGILIYAIKIPSFSQYRTESGRSVKGCPTAYRFRLPLDFSIFSRIANVFPDVLQVYYSVLQIYFSVYCRRITAYCKCIPTYSSCISLRTASVFHPVFQLYFNCISLSVLQAVFLTCYKSLQGFGKIRIMSYMKLLVRGFP